MRLMDAFVTEVIGERERFPVLMVVFSIGVLLCFISLFFVPLTHSAFLADKDNIPLTDVLYFQGEWGSLTILLACFLLWTVYVDTTRKPLAFVFALSLSAPIAIDFYTYMDGGYFHSMEAGVQTSILFTWVLSGLLQISFLMIGSHLFNGVQGFIKLNSFSLLMSLAVCSLISILCFVLLTVADVSTETTPQPIIAISLLSVLSLLLYAYCLYGFLRQYRRQNDILAGVIVISLVPAILIQLYIPVAGQHVDKLYFLVIQVLKILVYVIPCTWVLLEFHHLYLRKKTYEEEMVQLNQRLSKSEFRYGSISQLMPTGVLLIDESGRIVEANDHVCVLFGYSTEEMLALSVEALVPKQIRSSHVGLRKAFGRENKMRQMAKTSSELAGLKKNGETVPVEIGLAPIQLDHRKYTLTTVVDVSERRQMMEELKEKNVQMDMAIEKLSRSNQQLERFAFVCSHDLQEPVRMVLSFSQLLEQRLRPQLDEKSKEYLNFVTDGAVRAREMITDILDFCRLDQSADSHKDIELSDICQKVSNTLQQTLIERHAEFTWDEHLPVIRAVSSQIFQLFLNLVNNGIKFNISDTPKVHISVHYDGDFCQIRFQDNGIGIEKKYQQKIFEIFQRLYSKAEFPGTGIGLAICKKIADQHGAHFTIESKSGEGSCFVLSWPRQNIKIHSQ